MPDKNPIQIQTNIPDWKKGFQTVLFVHLCNTLVLRQELKLFFLKSFLHNLEQKNTEEGKVNFSEQVSSSVKGICLSSVWLEIQTTEAKV